MRNLNLGLTLSLAAVLAGCGGGGGGGGSSIGSGTTVTPVVNNTQPVAVNLGPTGTEADLLYTSVTICIPGTTTCQTIPNVQVDTGSTGLRLLASQVTLALPQVTDATNAPVGDCVNFLDLSYLWGPVVKADVKLAGEVASSVPIQLATSGSFPAAPTACSQGGTAVASISDLGATGILGIGLTKQDCGSLCAGTTTTQPIYFSCPAAGCSNSPSVVPVANQLQNPVALFPQDNNGLLITLPQVPDLGSASVAGSLIFGIGTQSNNSMNSAVVLTPNLNDGDFSVTFKGVQYTAGNGGGGFIDSGSNGLFFLTPTLTGLAACPSNFPGFYCPLTETSFTAIATGANNVSAQIAFNIQNAAALFNANGGANAAFNNLGGSQTGTFDFGLPFFFNRSVFVAIQGQSTSAGAGPFWAF